MQRILCLTVAVLGSALAMYAADTGKRSAAESSASNCISEEEHVVSCDQFLTSAGDAVDDQTNAQNVAVQNTIPSHMGENMGSEAQLVQPEESETWPVFNGQYE